MNSNKNLVAIIGYHDGAAGQVASWFEQSTGLDIACFVIDSDTFTEIDIDEENKKRTCKTIDFPQHGFFKEKPIIYSSNWLNIIKTMKIKKVLCLESNNQKRLNQIMMVRKSGLELISAIHPSALILPHAKIDDGVWINARAIIGYKAEIQSGTIINTGAQIDHHNVLMECSQVDPGVVTAGNVVLERCCRIHTGAIIINRVKIGENTIIGAGAVVVNDIAANSTAVGVPARVISKL